MVQGRDVVTTVVIYDLSIGAIFNDLDERPITQISKSLQYLMLNMSVTLGLQDRHIFRPTMDN